MLRTAAHSITRNFTTFAPSAQQIEQLSHNCAGAAPVGLRRHLRSCIPAWATTQGPPTPEQEKAASADGDEGVDGTAAEAGPTPDASGSDADSAAENSMSMEELQAQLAQTSKDLDKALKSEAGLKDRVVRTLADMENLRTRTAQQVEDSRQFALQGFAKDVLDVADNIERALESVPAPLLDANAEEGDADTLRKNLQSLHNGVALSHKGMVKAFKSNGLEAIECDVGSDFDPNWHNAIFQLPSKDVEEGKVAAIVKKGYTLKGRVIRATEVGVARAQE